MDLVNSPLVTATFERGREPGIDDVKRQSNSENAGAETENIRIVVLSTEVRRKRVTAQGSANARYLVRGDRDAYARSAYQNSSIGGTVVDRVANELCVVGVIDRRFVVRPVVVTINTFRHQVLNDRSLHLHAGVIGSHCDHGHCLPCIGRPRIDLIQE